MEMEISELANRLESTQILATSVLEDSESVELKEVCLRLKEENQTLAKEIDHLKADRCADAEELVYLRWLNACLRYELRNYQPPPGRVVAKDLSKTLSPTSERKAKQLILDYATTEGGTVERSLSVPDFDSDRWSSSYDETPSSERDVPPSSSSASARSTRKMKFFRKLRKLIHGKEGGSGSHHARSPDISSPPRLSAGSSRFTSPTMRLSLDIPRPTNETGGSSSPVETPREITGRRSDLAKYADALKDSPDNNPKQQRARKSSSSYSFY